MNEIWKNVKGYKGIYQVSNLGRLKTYNWKNSGQERIMKPAKDADGCVGQVRALG